MSSRPENMLKFNSGQLVKLIDFEFCSKSVEGEFREIPYGTEGIVTKANRKYSQYNRDEYEVDFGTYGVHQGIYDYQIRKTEGVENFNDRDRIKEEYQSWVDRVSEDCDWKTNFSVGEIQEKYSEIALRYALRILEKAKQSEDPLKLIEDKISEIDNILNGE